MLQEQFYQAIESDVCEHHESSTSRINQQHAMRFSSRIHTSFREKQKKKNLKLLSALCLGLHIYRRGQIPDSDSARRGIYKDVVEVTGKLGENFKFLA